MGLLGLLGGKTRVQFIQNDFTVIQFDASMKEKHSRESPPTEFPIEDGSVISDYILLKPFQLDLTGIISDTPIGDAQGLITEVATTAVSSLVPPVGLVAAGIAAKAGVSLFQALSGSKNPSVAAYGQLLQLQQNAESFDVLTSLYRYPSMWIRSISVPRDAETANILLFDVSVVQLQLVKPQSVDLKIFADPSLASKIGELGQQESQLSSRFKQGFDDAGKAVKAVTGGVLGG